MADSIRILESRNPEDADTPRLSEQQLYHTFHVSPQLRQKAYEINLRLQAENGQKPTGKKIRESTSPKQPKASRPKNFPRRPSNLGDTPGYIYIVQSGNEFKIGCTESPRNRIYEYMAYYGVSTYVLTIKVKAMYAAELRLHRHFRDKWIRGEWFALTDADIETIRVMYGRKAA